MAPRGRSAWAASLPSLAAASAASALLAALAWRRLQRRRRGEDRLPAARPSLPLLGNALAYKADPVGFLERQRKELGTCFSMNMAGLHMAVMAGRQEMLQAAAAGEGVLSAQAATADFGFAETLGPFNVFFGTDLHKVVLKETGLSDCSGDLQRSLEAAVAAAVQAAMPLEQGAAEGRLQDALAAFRRMSLHATVLHLLGGPVLYQYDVAGPGHRRDFLKEFMVFQDHVEEATAKGVTLPGFLSQLLIWRPVRRERLQLQRGLAAAVRSAWAAGAPEGGAWLSAVHAFPSRDAIPAWRKFLQQPHGRGVVVAPADQAVSSEDAAELAVGLLFAAHKNPAIGAAQTLLFLLEHPAELQRVVAEVRKGGGRAAGADGPLRRSLLEALRLTAHTIGGIRKVVAPDGYCVATATGKQYRVAPGEYVVLSHSLPNRDPAVFPQPLSFQPSRFETRTFDEYELTTFSHGLHRCPGRNYAMRLMEALLAELLRRFDLSLAGPLPRLCHERATLAQRAGPCPLAYRAARTA